MIMGILSLFNSISNFIFTIVQCEKVVGTIKQVGLIN